MDYDELVKRLRVWSLDERRGDGMLLVRTSDAIVALQARVAELEAAYAALGKENAAVHKRAERAEADLAVALERLDSVAERDRLAIAAVEGVQQMRIDLAAAQKERDDALAAVDSNWVTHQQIVVLQQDLAAARALLKRQPPSDCRPCHECGAIWWSDEHGCWFVGGQRERTALAGKDAP